MLIENYNVNKKRIRYFLSLVFGIYLFFWIVMLVTPKDISKIVYSIFKFPLVFMGTPILSVMVTKKLTNDSSKLPVDFKIYKNPKMLLFAAVLPTLAVLCGFIIFYSIFPLDIDYNGKYIVQEFKSFGAPDNISFNVRSVISMYGVIFLISILCVPSWFISIGEDFGWQGYLLPLLCECMGGKKICFINRMSLGSGAFSAHIFWYELWRFIFWGSLYWNFNDDIILYDNWSMDVLCDYKNK